MKCLAFVLTMSLIMISCTRNNEPTDEENKKYSELGKQIVNQSFESLKGRLGKAIQDGGFSQAIEYCNIIAHPLLDSLSSVYNVEIRRSSMKVRNPKNIPDKLEKEILEAYMKMKYNGNELKPVVKKSAIGDFYYFAPIVIESPICLGCHGEVGEMLSYGNNQLIKSLYPNDGAIGYKLEDLRGVWSIKFRNN